MNQKNLTNLETVLIDGTKYLKLTKNVERKLKLIEELKSIFATWEQEKRKLLEKN